MRRGASQGEPATSLEEFCRARYFGAVRLHPDGSGNACASRHAPRRSAFPGECCEGLGVVGMPARQRGPVFDDIAGRPQDTPLVEASWYVVVGTEDVEIAGFQALDHEVDRLLGCPGAGRLFGAAACGKTREDVAGYQEMGSDLTACGAAQLVRQRLGERLHAGLADVIGGLTRRR